METEFKIHTSLQSPIHLLTRNLPFLITHLLVSQRKALSEALKNERLVSEVVQREGMEQDVIHLCNGNMMVC